MFSEREGGNPQNLRPTFRVASLRKAVGLPTVRFHDGRHTALTRLAEAGQADWVIQAQLGHVSPAMMKTYSHIRRKALDAAAAALEPPRTEQPDGAMDGVQSGDPSADYSATSQATSQSASTKGVGLELRILAPISGLSNVAQHEPSALR